MKIHLSPASVVVISCLRSLGASTARQVFLALRSSEAVTAALNPDEVFNATWVARRLQNLAGLGWVDKSRRRDGLNWYVAGTGKPKTSTPVADGGPGIVDVPASAPVVEQLVSPAPWREPIDGPVPAPLRPTQPVADIVAPRRTSPMQSAAYSPGWTTTRAGSGDFLAIPSLQNGDRTAYAGIHPLVHNGLSPLKGGV